MQKTVVTTQKLEISMKCLKIKINPKCNKILPQIPKVNLSLKPALLSSCDH